MDQLVEGIVQPYVSDKNNIIVAVSDACDEWSKDRMFLYLLHHVTSATVCFVHNKLDVLDDSRTVDEAHMFLNAKYRRIRDQFANNNVYHYGLVANTTVANNCGE